jgi:hypothetical protein
MNDICTVKEYGIPKGKIIGSFGLDRLNDVLKEIFEHKDLILKAAVSGEIITFGEFTPYHVTGTVKLYENGLLISFEEHNDQNAKHEDAGKSELFMMDNEVMYIVTEIDPRINKEYKINTEKVNKYREKMGALLTIPEELKEATSFSEKIKFFFNKKKRTEHKERRDTCLLRINSYVDKLISIDIEKLN